MSSVNHVELSINDENVLWPYENQIVKRISNASDARSIFETYYLNNAHNLTAIIEFFKCNPQYFMNSIYMKKTTRWFLIQKAFDIVPVDGIIGERSCDIIKKKLGINLIDTGYSYAETESGLDLPSQFQDLVSRYPQYLKEDRKKCYLCDKEYIQLLKEIKKIVWPVDINLSDNFLLWFMRVEGRGYLYPAQRFNISEWSDKWPFQIKKQAAEDVNIPYKPYNPLYAPIIAALYLKKFDGHISWLKRQSWMIACYNMWPTRVKNAGSYSKLNPITKQYIKNASDQIAYYEKNGKINTTLS